MSIGHARHGSGPGLKIDTCLAWEGPQEIYIILTIMLKNFSNFDKVLKAI
jgi:hypothetical protein